jgi:hypothetical protein
LKKTKKKLALEICRKQKTLLWSFFAGKKKTILLWKFAESKKLGLKVAFMI